VDGTNGSIRDHQLLAEARPACDRKKGGQYVGIALEIILWPFMALRQTAAGVSYPSREAGTRRLQIVTFIVAAIGCLGLAAASVLWFIGSFAYAVLAFGEAFVWLLVGGALGRRIERRCARENATGS
jgi:hypothetical protein